jgi:hypothetical protein
MPRALAVIFLVAAFVSGPGRAASQEVISDGVIIIPITPPPCGYCIPNPPPGGGGGGNDCPPGSIICIHFDAGRADLDGIPVAQLMRGFDYNTILLARLQATSLAANATDAGIPALPALSGVAPELAVLDDVFGRARATGRMTFRDYLRARSATRHATDGVARILKAGPGPAPSARLDAFTMASRLVPTLEQVVSVLREVGERAAAGR